VLKRVVPRREARWEPDGDIAPNGKAKVATRLLSGSQQMSPQEFAMCRSTNPKLHAKHHRPRFRVMGEVHSRRPCPPFSLSGSSGQRTSAHVIFFLKLREQTSVILTFLQKYFRIGSRMLVCNKATPLAGGHYIGISDHRTEKERIAKVCTILSDRVCIVNAPKQ
jgi:hypothetical protein